MPWTGAVRLVTPGGPGVAHKGVDAFEDELLNQLEWQKLRHYGFTYDPYRAHPPGGLAVAATSAVNDALAEPAGTVNVIVTDGSATTDAVLAVPGAAGIPIVQAVGGRRFPGIPNVTGFSIDAQDTCMFQLNNNNLAVGPVIPTVEVRVLWDGVSPIQGYIAGHLPAGKNLQFISLNQLTTTAGIIDNSTLVMIPSADFFLQRNQIAHAVDNCPTAHAIYHEREYKNEHPIASRGRVEVYGHLVPFTFRKAAALVDKILRRVILPGALPAMDIAEPDQGSSPPP